MKIYSPACDYLSFSFDVLFLEEVISHFTSPHYFLKVNSNDSVSGSLPLLLSRRCSPRLGYDEGLEFYYSDTVYFRLFTGGHNSDRPFITSTGRHAESLRIAFSKLVCFLPLAAFKITRIDIAIDFISSDFDRISYLLDAHAQQSNIKSSVAGDFMRGKDGRTLYLGSRQSRFFFRLYEKGLESSGIKDHLRAELEIKPSDVSVSNQLLPFIDNLDKLLGFWRFSPKMLEIIGYDLSNVSRETIKTNSAISELYSSVYHMHRNYSLLYQRLCGLFPQSDISDFLLTSSENIKGIEDVKNFFDSRY